jgi:mono/diheme cytochrome c family protein
MRRLAVLTLLAVAACARAAAPQQDDAKEPPAGPPPIPPYQMRAAMPAGDRLASGGDGQALFANLCGSCHLAGGMGTNMLTKERMAAGEPPESGLLANRKDLTQSYVKAVVRHGIRAMPRLTRVEVTDAELDAIAQYLGKAGK